MYEYKSRSQILREADDFLLYGERAVKRICIPKKTGTRILFEPSPEYKAVLGQLAKLLKQAAPASKLACNSVPLVAEALAMLNYRTYRSSKLRQYLLRLDLTSAFNNVTESLAVSSFQAGTYKAKILAKYIPLYFFENSLPQGFPTSPALFNLCLKKCEDRIDLERKAHRLDINSTRTKKIVRYVDDFFIYFRSLPKDVPEGIKQIIRKIEYLLKQYNQSINHSKTKVYAFEKADLVKAIPARTGVGFNILGMVLDKNKPGFRPTKKARNKERLYSYLHGKTGSSKELEQLANGHRGYINAFK